MTCHRLGHVASFLDLVLLTQPGSQVRSANRGVGYIPDFKHTVPYQLNENTCKMFRYKCSVYEKLFKTSDIMSVFKGFCVGHSSTFSGHLNAISFDFRCFHRTFGQIGYKLRFSELLFWGF